MQKTIRNSISIAGIGIHTGVNTNITLKPAKINSGIRFIRTDLSNKAIIKANINNAISNERNTKLKNLQFEINTVEHILAAVIGSKIDNLIIEIDNIEVPILDGSAKSFTEIILRAGIKTLNAKKDFFQIKKDIHFADKETGSIFTASPSSNYEVEVEIDYNSKVLGTQKAKTKSINEFNNTITSARTFCFLHEIQPLLKNNLIKGGNINNALVFIEKDVAHQDLDNLKNTFNNPDLELKKGKTLNNIKLRYENEPARHKLLDLIGDLALLGKPIKGKITAYKPGHKSNIKFAKELIKTIKNG